MQLIVMYISTAAIFLIADAIMLTNVLKPLFEKHLGDWIVEPIRVAPAGIFYLFYVAGLLWLVSWPALRTGNSSAALLNGAVLGALAYGTYEFTSYAIMTRWSWQTVAVDTIWGTVLTAGAAWGGLKIAQMVG